MTTSGPFSGTHVITVFTCVVKHFRRAKCCGVLCVLHFSVFEKKKKGTHVYPRRHQLLRQFLEHTRPYSVTVITLVTRYAQFGMLSI